MLVVAQRGKFLVQPTLASSVHPVPLCATAAFAGLVPQLPGTMHHAGLDPLALWARVEVSTWLGREGELRRAPSVASRVQQLGGQLPLVLGPRLAGPAAAEVRQVVCLLRGLLTEQGPEDDQPH